MANYRLLNTQIIDFVNNMEDTPSNRVKKENAFDEIKSIINGIEPNAEVLIFGSCGNGFQTRESDMDLTILLAGSSCYAYNKVRFLRDLERSLKTRATIYTCIQVISQATVPIIKFTNARYGIPMDVSVNNKSAVFNAVLLKAYSHLDERVKPLFIALKKWAKEAGILDPRNNRLASFVLQLLVIHYLQSGCHPRVLPALQQQHPSFFNQDIKTIATHLKGALPSDLLSFRTTNMQSIGELMVGFFEHYCFYDWARNGISVREGTNIRRPPKRGSNNTCLYVEDPYERSSNTARAVFKHFIWESIMSQFHTAKRLLQQGKSFHELMLHYGVNVR